MTAKSSTVCNTVVYLPCYLRHKGITAFPTGNPKDKVVILERELSSAQTRIAQLEQLARSLETDKDELQASLRDHQRALAEKEDQLQELLGKWKDLNFTLTHNMYMYCVGLLLGSDSL